MINEEIIEAFNTKALMNVGSLKKLSPSQLDTVKSVGSEAEYLINNRYLATFIHQTRFAIMDSLSEITGHSVDDNNKRVAYANQLSGLDAFINTLKSSVHLKNVVIKQQTTGNDK